jgi:hypothetical protein
LKTGSDLNFVKYRNTSPIGKSVLADGTTPWRPSKAINVKFTTRPPSDIGSVMCLEEKTFTVIYLLGFIINTYQPFVLFSPARWLWC